jgi:hypothetical protein
MKNRSSARLFYFSRTIMSSTMFVFLIWNFFMEKIQLNIDSVLQTVCTLSQLIDYRFGLFNFPTKEGRQIVFQLRRLGASN